jgi:hypothetical protein
VHSSLPSPLSLPAQPTFFLSFTLNPHFMNPIRIGFLIAIISISACTPTETNQAAQSTAENEKVDNPNVGHDTNPVEVNASHNFEGIDAESLTAELLKLNPMQGTVISSETAAEKFLDVSNVEGTRELLAIWIQTGAGEYQGAHERDYQTVYSRLAVFEIVDTVTKLIDIKDFESGSQGLYVYEETIETYELAQGRQAIVVHHESSEQGAGDSGFSTDEIEVFAIKDNKLHSIFTTTLNESSFSSDEMGSYAESKTTRELKVLSSKTNGLFDFSIYTKTYATSFEEPEETEETDSESDPAQIENSESEDAESEPEETEQSTEHEGDYPQDPATVVYHWSGEQYLAEDVD